MKSDCSGLAGMDDYTLFFAGKKGASLAS
jgi:hypothetical protein